MATIHFKVGDSGDAVRDIKRKLASLDPKGDPELIAFKTEPHTGHFNEVTAAAIRAFKNVYGNGKLSDVGDCDEDTWRLLNDQAGSVFGETWQFEIDAMRGQIPKDVEPVRDSLTQEAHRLQLAGLAFSGGGIRSATFNLGMLQALAELRMLRNFAYLSTVSGGGYIGAWFSKWLKRQEGSITNIERELTPGSPDNPRREPEEVKFLRQYTNYLTPKTGFFSADTWTLLATYVRNTLLNLTILTLLLAAVMVVPRLLARFVDQASKDEIAWLSAANRVLSFSPFSLFSIIAIAAVLWSVFWIAASVSCVPKPKSRHRLWRQSQNSVICFVVLPLMVAAFFGSAALWQYRTPISDAWAGLFAFPSLRNPIIAWLLAPGLCYFAAWCAGWTYAQWQNEKPAPEDGTKPDKEEQAAKLAWKDVLVEAWGHFLCAIVALAVGTVLVVMTTSALNTWHNAPAPVAAITTPTATQAVTSAAMAVTSAAQAVTNAALGGAISAPPAVASTVVAATPAPGANRTVPIIAFGMPILLALFGLTMVLCVGLVGRLYTDKSREWWSRQSGWTAIFLMGWLVLITVSLYAPAVVGYFHAKFGDVASGLLGSAWLATTLGGLMLGKSSATGSPNGKSRLDWIARVAPLVFSIGALCLVSTLLHTALLPVGTRNLADSGTSFIGFLAEYDRQTILATRMKLWLTLAGLITVGMLLAWRVDINKFSLHMMYRNRLVRAYLGAITAKRQPHPFTGFDPADDEHMEDLLETNDRLQRPYHIVNTALNLVNGKELAWQTRKAANFTFTPAFCGFELPSMASPGGAMLAHEALRGGFRRTSAYHPKKAGRHDEERGINLGMAVAVSGAAASPSMGYHSSPPLAFLMTLFNVRLGRWFANPVRPLSANKGNAGPPAGPVAVEKDVANPPLDTVSSEKNKTEPPGELVQTSPRLGLWYLLKELFGLTDAKSNFVYLSDGGHFENLGIYELVRRRCRLVVVVDAGADGHFDFEDLGNAIRKCGTDLNVEIEIDVGRIDLLKPAEFSRSHCVTGTIRYDKVDRGAPVGTLLYIKPSLLGTEYADVLNYRKTNNTFPHQATADQWFDETQFETYRSLGYKIGKIALANAANAVNAAAFASYDNQARCNIALLCEALHANWDDPAIVKDDVKKAPPPPHLAQNRRSAHRRQPPIATNPLSAVIDDRRQVERRHG